MKSDGSCVWAIFQKDRLTTILSTKFDDKDSLLCNQATQFEDVAEVGSLAVGDSLLHGSRTNIHQPADVSNQISESRLDLLNTSSAPHPSRPEAGHNRTPSVTTHTNINLVPVPTATLGQLNVSTTSANDANVTRLTGAARRAMAAKQSAAGPPPPPLQPLQANPYLGLVNIDDIFQKHTVEERLTIAPLIVESLLRIHSQLSEIYTEFSKQHPGEAKIGTVMTRRQWWLFCRRFRLNNSRATQIEVDRLIALGKKNNFEAWMDLTQIKTLVDQIKAEAGKEHLPKTSNDSDKANLVEKSKLPRLDSFDDKSESTKELVQAAKIDDEMRGSLSLDLDILEFMKDPQTYPEVKTFLQVFSFRSMCNEFQK